MELPVGTEFQIKFRNYMGKTFQVIRRSDTGSPVGLQHDCELNNLPRGLKSDSWIISAAALGEYQKRNELSILFSPDFEQLMGI